MGHSPIGKFCDVKPEKPAGSTFIVSIEIDTYLESFHGLPVIPRASLHRTYIRELGDDKIRDDLLSPEVHDLGGSEASIVVIFWIPGSMKIITSFRSKPGPSPLRTRYDPRRSGKSLYRGVQFRF
jgi:hypothetical protein